MTRRLNKLLFSATRLQADIEREQRRPRPDSIALLRMKMLRLRLKDRMHALIEPAAHRSRRALTVAPATA